MRALPPLLVLALVLPCAAEEEEEEGVPLPRDDFLVTGAVRVRPGTYYVADADGDGVIHVRGPDARLDLRGVTIVGCAPEALGAPDAYTGVGVAVDDAPGAAVTGGTVRGFKIGVRVHGAPGAVVEDLDASSNFRQRLGSTVEREDARDWLFGHRNDAGEWESRYGAGIALADSPAAVVRRCRVRDGQNGLLLQRCDGAQAYDNDFSFNSGWGVALWRTNEAVVCRNRLDWCVRGYSHGVYDRGQDSTGILAFEQCSRNVFALNSATHGGDGFFLWAGHESLDETGAGGSNGNVLWRNDFSHAVANAIEATFSVGNVFLDNRLDDSRHGVWAGYSRETTIRGNRIRGCGAGISIEHGKENGIDRNVVSDCRVGVHLWWDPDEDLARTVWGRGNDLRSVRNRVGPFNEFRGNGVDVRLASDLLSRVVWNRFEGRPPVVELHGTTAGTLFAGNAAAPEPLRLVADQEGAAVWQGGRGEFRRPNVVGRGPVKFDEFPELAEPSPEAGPDDLAPPFDPSTLPGEQDPFLPEDALRGRRYILVDEWGPVDPRQTRLFPARVEGSGAARVSVLGAEGTFQVASLSDGFVAEPRDGTLPATVTIRRADAAETGVWPFEIEVETRRGEETVVAHRASGTLFCAPWDVRFFHFKTDPREDARAFADLLAGEPVERRTEAALAYRWGASAPSDAVGRDRFATLATTAIDLPAGRYELRTVSDDGIRVWVDDRLVVEDWTHHGPTPHDVPLDLAAGRHTIRVEHFELDGWAVLEVTLVPAP